MAVDSGFALRILIIDDDSVMVELLSALFEHQGHQVSACSSGEAALGLVRDKQRSCDVILSDVRLPGLHGAELAGALNQARRPGTVLLGMSGSQPDQDEIEMLDGFLLKPFTTQEFEAAVRRAGEPGAVPAAGDDGSKAGGRTGARRRKPTSHGDDRILNSAVFESLRSALDEEQLRQVYALTLEDTQHRLERMEISAEQGDFDTVRREAHTIRGSTGMVGATELHLLATATEGGAPGNTPAITEFRSACQRLQRMLDETFAH